MTSAAHEPVRVAAAGMAIPHPEKVTKQKGVNQQGSGHAGEDSYFFCEGRCVEGPRRQCRRRGSMSQGSKDRARKEGCGLGMVIKPCVRSSSMSNILSGSSSGIGCSSSGDSGRKRIWLQGTLIPNRSKDRSAKILIMP